MCDPYIDIVLTMPSASFRPCALPQRRFDALATNVGAISGLDGLFDDAAAEANLPLVQNHRLTGSDGPLRRLEINPVSLPGAVQGAGLVGLAVTDFGGAEQGQFGLGTGYPVNVCCQQG